MKSGEGKKAFFNKDLIAPEPEFKKRYEYMVHFLHHEYLASIATFEGLVQLLEHNRDPYLIYFQLELDKLKTRARIIEELTSFL